MRTTAENAELALLLELAGTPTPGNVDRRREYEDLRFEHLIAGGVGTREGFRAAAKPDRWTVGEAFERAIEGMSCQSAGNTQFGAVLLLTPLVRAATRDDLSLSGEDARSVAEETTVEDAVQFYRAFDHVDVSVRDPPEGMEALDVGRGSDAAETIREREITLYEIMELSAGRDGIAREWTDGFDRTFRAASAIAGGTGPVIDRAAETYLWLLSREPDTFVAANHGRKTAHSVMVRAQEAREGGPDLVEAFADSLVESAVNPGTTADLTAGGLFVALERDGVEV
jgi:triphosphoribosyl-dephospho-CoA synthase